MTLDDFDEISTRLGTVPGQSGFDPDMDHDLDGVIDSDDTGLAAAYVGLPPGPTGLFCVPQPGSQDIPVAFDSFVRLERGREHRGHMSAVDPNGSPVTYRLLSFPTSGSLVSIDLNSGEFIYVANARGTALTDGFDFEASDGTFSSPPARVSIEFWEPADDDYSGEDLAASVLVVYNDNAPDSLDIAQYYATARGVSADRLCAVELPTGLYAHKDDLLAARESIVSGCICPLIPAGIRPTPCDAGNADAVADLSPIRHLALIRGMPARLYGTGWSGDAMEPSLDPYLSYLLTNAGDPFGAPQLGLIPDLYGDDLLAPFHRRAIEPALDRRLAYGRIEAMSRPRTEALIDRTLAAEAQGFSGKVLSELVSLFDASRRYTGDMDPSCEDSVTSGLSPPSACRSATTATTAPALADGAIPGEGGSTISAATGVGLFLGGQPLGNGHTAFDGTQTLGAWVKGSTVCAPRCSDYVTPQVQSACVASSEDWFQELNTTCVGGAPGLIGMQLRSYTVTGYGFHPTGWLHGVAGSQGQTASLELPVGGYVGGPFADSAYVHYGVHDVANPDNSTCPRVGGGSVPCSEVIGVELAGVATPAAPIPVAPDRTFEVKLRHRNSAAVGAQLDVSLILEDLSGLSYTLGPIPLDLSAGALSWNTQSVMLNASGGRGSEVADLRVVLSADVPDGVRGWLDLDAVEVVDVATGTNLLPLDVGGFAVVGDREAKLGDWAATAIDRLGAVGWWGSSSHHLTAGFAFDDQLSTLRAFFAGRTLGESVAAAGRPESGILYGDPLYRPSAAALYFPSEGVSKTTSSVLDPTPPPPLVVDLAHLETYRYLFVNAYHGSANTATLRWQIASCPGLDEIACDAAGSWTVVMDQTGAVREKPINWSQQLVTPGLNQQVTLRLEVWSPAEPESALYDYVHLDYQPVNPQAP